MEQLVDASRNGELLTILSSAAKYTNTDSSQSGEKVITYYPVNFQGAFTVIRLEISDSVDTSLIAFSFVDSSAYYDFFRYLTNSEKISGYNHLFDYTKTGSFGDSLKSYYVSSEKSTKYNDSYMLRKEGLVVYTNFDDNVIITQIKRQSDITKETVDSLARQWKSVKK